MNVMVWLVRYGCSDFRVVCSNQSFVVITMLSILVERDVEYYLSCFV